MISQSEDLHARAASELRPWHFTAWLECSEPLLVFRCEDLILLDANPAGEALFPAAGAERAPRSVAEIFEPDDAARLGAAVRRPGSAQALRGLRSKAGPDDARVFDAKLVLSDDSPAICVCRLAELRRPTTDAELRRLNWALAAYARSSTALMHFADLEQLVTSVCQAIVGDDHYLAAAVGLAQDTPDKAVRLVAGAGQAVDYVDGLRVSWSENVPEGAGPVGIAIRSGEAFLMRDAREDPAFVPWRERAARYGIRSSITVPFSRGGRTIGVVMVYAGRPDAFGPQELDVFVKLGHELAFAMTVQEARDQLKASEAARRVAEQSARDSQAELARASRLLSLGVFASSIAHEINQPVAAIMTNGDAALRWLAKSPPNGDEAVAALNRIIRDARRASEVVSRTRGLLTKARYARKPLDINMVLRDALAFTEGDQQRCGVQVETSLAPMLPPVHGDPTQLQQVAINLIINAIDAMRTVEDRPRVLTLASTQDPSLGKIVVELSDTGPGIEALDRERIFESFVTTKPEGIGLGLPIARSIIESHGGSMAVRQNQPFGAVFEFYLPIAKT
jgi:signal transduction histidine kinase